MKIDNDNVEAYSLGMSLEHTKNGNGINVPSRILIPVWNYEKITTNGRSGTGYHGSAPCSDVTIIDLTKPRNSAEIFMHEIYKQELATA
ncbi:MAG: hypothetical protein ABIA21_03870 [Candidatus Aenigmatarchaeota archaeon]